jgi:hypothetical protein
MRNEYYILVGKLEVKGQLGILRRKWENKIRMDVEDIRWEVTDSFHLVQDRYQCRALVNTVMNLRAPYKAENLTS